MQKKIHLWFDSVVHQITSRVDNVSSSRVRFLSTPTFVCVFLYPRVLIHLPFFAHIGGIEELVVFVA